ncbi:alanine racemase [Flocculibacter collagenilyticus]|uniref:alanine racemase n=1 Tax=Flocculibacter collagenilyticus TaxID=2744479 RepID=UPI0018F4543F|nr:alanine racemase [Flocculibacter collagenilyticus]
MISATAEISVSALQHNLARVRAFAPHSQVLAVLKANAYGHGMSRTAKHLDNADAFGVARIGEALRLREQGITKSVVLMEGFFEAEEVYDLVEYGFETVVQNQHQLDAIVYSKLRKPIKVWLKIDTGMHRLGIEPEQFEHFYRTLVNSPNVLKPIVVMSHFACADEHDNPFNQQQMQVFDGCMADTTHSAAPPLLSLANSAAVVNYPSSHHNWVRPGIMLYGISPVAEHIGQKYGLQPAMAMKSKLIAVRKIKKDEAVGYGSAWRSHDETFIGVVAIGYGDGYPRHAPNGTPVLVNGRQVPLVGRVSMDMITVDLGKQSHDKIGDEVLLWGAELPIEVVAEKAGTIAYQLICNITRRVNLHYVD